MGRGIVNARVHDPVDSRLSPGRGRGVEYRTTPIATGNAVDHSADMEKKRFTMGDYKRAYRTPVDLDAPAVVSQFGSLTSEGRTSPSLNLVAPSMASLESEASRATIRVPLAAYDAPGTPSLSVLPLRIASN
ncbi:MAG: hypothetical protein V3S33_04620 [Gammaproteobacteria bacterium]